MSHSIPKPAPSKTEKSHYKRLGSVYDDALPIFFHETVLEAVLDYSEQDVTRELGGFLLGGVEQDARQYVEIRHFLPAVDVHSRAASLTFTHETWARMNREVATKFPNDVVVGWHHTHPGFGVFLSGYDLFIHRNYFSSPFHVAMVVDPKRQEFGFFQWRSDEIVDCGFVCVQDSAS